MGREIRRVPPNWEHPKRDDGKYQPMLDEDYGTHIKKWIDGYLLWQEGKHPDQKDEEYWEWEGEPSGDSSYFRPKFTEEPTWYQMYETVSEGTPVTPPFATKEELVEYLVKYGDFSDQVKGLGGWHKNVAKKFVETGWAPSGAMILEDGVPKFKTPRDGI